MTVTTLCLAFVLLCAKGFAQSDSCENGARNATTTPEVTQGPYHISEALLRYNVTEGQPGIPLTLVATVRDTNCRPVDAFVEIWSANATGSYSGVIEQGDDDSNANTTFLRGLAPTNDNGIAQLQTIIPGMYQGRAVHIHFGIHIIPNDTSDLWEDYEESYLTHVGQIFFQDELVSDILQLSPYSESGGVSDPTYLADDNIYTGDENTIAQVTFLQADALTTQAGLSATAEIEIIVNPMTVREYSGDYDANDSQSGMMGGAGAMGPMPAGGMMGGAMGPRPAGGIRGPGTPSA